MLFKNKPLLFAVGACFVARIVTGLVFTGVGDSFYWEYSELAKNLLASKGYSLFYFSGDTVKFLFDPSAKPFPSAFMPPGFPLFLIPFFLIKSLVLRDILILTSLSFIASLVTFYIYKLTVQIFSRKTAFISAYLYALLPQFIIATGRNGTTVIFHLLIILTFYLLYSHFGTEKRPGFSKTFSLGFILGLTIYFRQETLIFVFFLIIAFIIEKKFRHAILILFTVGIMLVPWQVRNYFTFNRAVMLSSSSGLNFYRGHNKYRPGVWLDEEIEREITKFKNDRNYEIRVSDMYFGLAIKYITENKAREVFLSAEKIFHLWIFNPYDKMATNPIYLTSWFLLLTTSVYGIYKNRNWKKHKFVYLFLLYYSLLVVLFFALPRYQIMFQVSLVPFSSYTILRLYEKMKKGIFSI